MMADNSEFEVTFTNKGTTMSVRTAVKAEVPNVLQDLVNHMDISDVAVYEVKTTRTKVAHGKMPTPQNGSPILLKKAEDERRKAELEELTKAGA